MDSPSPSLTYGVELEFMTPYLKIGHQDPLHQDPRYLPSQSPPQFRTNAPHHNQEHETDNGDNSVARAHGNNTIRDRIVAHTFDVLVEHARVPVRIAKTYPTDLGDDGIYKEHRKWNLTEEESLDDLDMGENVPPDYGWIGVEVTSPVWRAYTSNSDTGTTKASENRSEITASAATPIPSQKDREQLRRVCRVLTEHLRCTVNQGRGNHRVGMHVHVGWEGHGFSVLQVKKFASMMWISEPIWMGLHASWRKGYKYARLMKNVSNLALLDDEACAQNTSQDGKTCMSQHVPKGFIESSEGKKLAALWSAESMEKLAWYLSREQKLGRMGFGFRELVDNPEKAKQTRQNTIEWRHMQGSLDAEHIMQWVIVCLRMMWLATGADTAEYRQVTEKVYNGWLCWEANPGRYEAPDFLSDIGLPSQAEYFRGIKDGVEADAVPTASIDNGWDRIFLSPAGMEVAGKLAST